MNNKGQALVEFVLILPIFILFLFIIIDFGMIISTKNSLENKSNDVVNLIYNDEEIDVVRNMYDDITITLNDNGRYLNISLEKEVKIITPGLDRVLSNPYIVKVERVIYND